LAKKSIVVEGNSFPSVRAAAIHFGLRYQNVARRLNSGWSVEEALGLKTRKRPGRGKALITSSGTFPSIRDAAEHFCIEEMTLHRRLGRGWSPDEAVGLQAYKKKPRATKMVVCQGVAYPNSWTMAKAHGKGCKLVAKRLLLGWTAEQAVELEAPPPRFRNQIGGARDRSWKEVEIVDEKAYPATGVGEYKLYVIRNLMNSKEYVGITITPLWMRFNGHKNSAKKGAKSKLYNAIRFYGAENFTIELLRSDARSFAELQNQEVEEISKRDTISNGYNVSPGGAIGTPEPIQVGAQVFPSRASAAEYFAIDPSVFNLRLSRLGWTPEQAAEIEPRGKYARRKVEVNGISFPSLKAAAEHFKIDYKLVHDRFTTKGWTLERALGLSALRETARTEGVPVEAFGMAFPSISACAREFHIKPASLRKRIVDYGQSAEEAIRHLQSKATSIAE